MKKIMLLGIFVLVFLQACSNTTSRTSNEILHLEITLDRAKYCSIKEVHGKAILNNVSNTPILVYKRLIFAPIRHVFPYTPGYLLIEDPLGKLIEPLIKIDEIRAEEDDFVLMPVGIEIEADIDIYKTFLSRDSYFQQSGEYKMTAIYQNDLQVKKIIDGMEVNSWIGEISSNEVLFQIDANNCR
ncbi:MAG: hypothetical protein HY869_14890 [Chloroflexi bacterium]|nr:hypothetical protein [Chloroflexota bacterium]